MNWLPTLTISRQAYPWPRGFSMLLLGLSSILFAGCATLQSHHETLHILGNQPTGVIYESAGFNETTWGSLESNTIAYEEITHEEIHDVSRYFTDTDEPMPVDRYGE